MTNHLREIEALGQSIWLDNISRALIEDGELQRLVDEDGLSGVTSNPTIFEKAMGHSDRYDTEFRAAVEQGLDARGIFFRLAIQDIQEGADILRPTWEATEGADGYISFELPPELANDTSGSVEGARHWRSVIDRPNAYIKVPGTEAGVPAFRELTAEGISINVTLLFAVSRYEEIAEAYIGALEERVARGEPVDRISSVASFFVSRVDTKVDAALEEKGRQDLQGKAAVANAKVAYESFRRLFSGPRWEALARKGANPQRPLWASTSTKNPKYSDVLYVDELIGPDTVNTMPDQTIAAARDHANPTRAIDRDVPAAHVLLDEIRALGIDLDDIVEVQLVEEGVASFAKSFESLIETIDEKRAAMAKVTA